MRILLASAVISPGILLVAWFFVTLGMGPMRHEGAHRAAKSRALPPGQHRAPELPIGILRAPEELAYSVTGNGKSRDPRWTPDHLQAHPDEFTITDPMDLLVGADRAVPVEESL